MGTFAVIAVHGADRAKLEEAVSAAFRAIQDVDRAMSLHRPESELVRLNQRAVAEPVRVSEDLFGVLAMAQSVAKETEGAFDVTIRPLAELWGFIWKDYRMPTDEELKDVLPRVNFHHVSMVEESSTVRFAREGVSLDLGGIAKGYAVDRAMETLRASGVLHALIRIGGDLRVQGQAPGLTGWEVQLEDPLKRGQRRTLLLSDVAVSTSGDYENYFVVEGRRYGHLLDPRTGYPVSGVAACSVVAPTCIESDAWSTALYVMGPERGLKEFGERFPVEYTLVSERGEPELRTRASPAFEALKTSSDREP